MRKIAITGKARAGKDSVADILVCNYGFDTCAFGDGMKGAFHATFPWIHYEPKPRAEYQRFGEDMRRLYGEDIWVRHVAGKVAFLERFSRRLPGIVITDLRLPIEYEWCRDNGFEIVRVSSPYSIRIERARQAGDDFNEKDFEHDTEMYVDEFEVDYEIDNDGDLVELERKVDEIMRPKVEK